MPRHWHEVGDLSGVRLEWSSEEGSSDEEEVGSEEEGAQAVCTSPLMEEVVHAVGRGDTTHGRGDNRSIPPPVSPPASPPTSEFDEADSSDSGQPLDCYSPAPMLRRFCADGAGEDVFTNTDEACKRFLAGEGAAPLAEAASAENRQSIAIQGPAPAPAKAPCTERESTTLPTAEGVRDEQKPSRRHQNSEGESGDDGYTSGESGCESYTDCGSYTDEESVFESGATVANDGDSVVEKGAGSIPKKLDPVQTNSLQDNRQNRQDEEKQRQDEDRRGEKLYAIQVIQNWAKIHRPRVLRVGSRLRCYDGAVYSRLLANAHGSDLRKSMKDFEQQLQRMLAREMGVDSSALRSFRPC